MALLDELGDDEAERLRRVHFGLLRDVVTAHGGQEVKNLGDGLMVAFPSAVNAVSCAIGIQQAVHRHNARRGDDRLQVRVGLNVGEPIRDEGDYFGTPVVVAKRLCDTAGGGQILASGLVRGLVGSRGSFTFRSLGQTALKGISEPLETWEVAWEPVVERRIGLPDQLLPDKSAPFVGRDAPLQELRSHWQAARARRAARRNARRRARDRQDPSGGRVLPQRPSGGSAGPTGTLLRGVAGPLPGVRGGRAPLHVREPAGRATSPGGAAPRHAREADPRAGRPRPGGGQLRRRGRRARTVPALRGGRIAAARGRRRPSADPGPGRSPLG